MATMRTLMARAGVAALGLLLLCTGLTMAQGAVTPSWSGGILTVEGEGYRAGERVKVVVKAAGAGHDFEAVADTRGRFRLATGLVIPPLSAVEIEATDEAGMTQATKTNVPGVGASPRGGNLPAASATALPTQLPRTGEIASVAWLVAPLALAGTLMVVAGLMLMWSSPAAVLDSPRGADAARSASEGQRTTFLVPTRISAVP